MNQVLETMMNHRSIRSFTEQALTKEEIGQLVAAAQAASTSNFYQAFSIIRVTDPEKKAAIAQIGNQAYIDNKGELFIFLVDFRRNVRIAQALGQELGVEGTTDRFLAGASDALIAAQNMVLAAESMGMGAVFLGSIRNDLEALIELLELPQLTFPLIGLTIGWPNQEPQLKPRLPQEVILMENTYQDLADPLNELADYDAIVHEYYDLRDANRRVDTFTQQVGRSFASLGKNKRHLSLDILRKQGFMSELDED